MKSMNMRDWILSLPSSPLPTQAATAAGIDISTISRQLKRNHISAENVIKLCKAFGKSPIDGLIETGYLSPTDAQEISISSALRDATNRQLAAEVTRRMDIGLEASEKLSEE